jgi:putative nucleic acid binding protein
MKRAIRPAQLVFGVLEGIAIGAVLGGWQLFTKTPLNMRTAFTLAGTYGVLKLLHELQRGYEEVTAESVSTEKVEKRVFVDDPEVVLELAKLTGYEAIRRFTPYLGKWMTISGTFDGIAESLQRDSIHLSLLLSDGRRINLRFAMDYGERLREIKPGQRITVAGQIQQAAYFILVLEKCEVVRAEPLRRRERSILAYV